MGVTKWHLFFDLNNFYLVKLVSILTSANKAVIPTLLNKSCSNKKINATLLSILILKVLETKFQGIYYFSCFMYGYTERPILALGSALEAGAGLNWVDFNFVMPQLAPIR